MKKDSLGDRMKAYENISRIYLTRRMPLIIRIDGKAFHTFTKGFEKPFDAIMLNSMWETAKYLCKNIMGCKIAYVQSDEISLLLTDYETLQTDAWFDKNIQKITSVSASMATLAFNNTFLEIVTNEYESKINDRQYTEDEVDEIDNYFSKYFKKANTALFDSRVFVLPPEEVCNYFLWRQQDATRNSILSIGQANFSFKQLQRKSCNEIQEMLFQDLGINFNNFPTFQKRGVCIYKENVEIENGVIRSKYLVDKDIPIFSQDRNYIEKYL